MTFVFITHRQKQDRQTDKGQTEKWTNGRTDGHTCKRQKDTMD